MHFKSSGAEYGFIPIRITLVEPVFKLAFIEDVELLHVDAVPLEQRQKFPQGVLVYL